MGNRRWREGSGGIVEEKRVYSGKNGGIVEREKEMVNEMGYKQTGWENGGNDWDIHVGKKETEGRGFGWVG